MAAKKTPARTSPRKSPRKAAANRGSAAKSGRSIATYALGALGVAGGAMLTAFLARAFAARRGSAEHVPTDLLGSTRPGPEDRAPVDFRPDPTAAVPPGERESLRPATLVAAS